MAPISCTGSNAIAAPLTLHTHTCHRPHTGHAGVFIPSTMNKPLSIQTSRTGKLKVTFQQHAVSYTLKATC